MVELFEDQLRLGLPSFCQVGDAFMLDFVRSSFLPQGDVEQKQDVHIVALDMGVKCVCGGGVVGAIALSHSHHLSTLSIAPSTKQEKK